MNIHEKINARQNANHYNILGLFVHVKELIEEGVKFTRTRDICLFQTTGYHRYGRNHSQYPGFYMNWPDKYLLRYNYYRPKTMPVDEFLYSNAPYNNQPVALSGHMWLT